MIVVGSVFRDSVGYLDRYLGQVARLREEAPVRLVVGEGDSVDGTAERLAEALLPGDRLLHVPTGGPRWPSVDDPRRWAQMAAVCNAVMDALDCDDDDTVVWVESDIVWTVDAVLALAARLATVTAVAPLCLHGPTGRNYETWGHVAAGVPFAAAPPYHPLLEAVEPGGLLPVDSAGSCVVMRAKAAREARFSPLDCIRGLGRDLNRLGGLFVDPSVEVWHP